MSSVNKVHLLGRITQKNDAKQTQGGMMILPFSLATNRRVKKGDEWDEEATFHNIIAFGKTAEALEKYTAKGDLLYIEGRISNRSWEKDDGTKGYRSEVVVETFQFMPKNKKADGTASTQSSGKGRPQEEDPDAEEPTLDDLPF